VRLLGGGAGALLLTPRGAFGAFGAFDAFRWNATRAALPTHAHDPPPQALSRVVDAAARHDVVTSETLDDLLATVGYLAKREMLAR